MLNPPWIYTLQLHQKLHFQHILRPNGFMDVYVCVHWQLFLRKQYRVSNINTLVLMDTCMCHAHTHTKYTQTQTFPFILPLPPPPPRHPHPHTRTPVLTWTEARTRTHTHTHIAICIISKFDFFFSPTCPFW